MLKLLRYCFARKRAVVNCGCLVAKSCPFLTPWTIAHQTALSMGFPRQENWSQLPFLALGDLPDPGTEFSSPALAGRFFTIELPGKTAVVNTGCIYCH